MTAGADLRLLRAAVFTAVCVALSAAGHAAATAAPLPLWTLGAASALVFALTAPLAGRERSLPGITAALAAGQVALHLLFAAGHRPPSPSGPSGDSGGIRALAARLLCNDGATGPLTTTEAHRVVAEAGLGPGPATQGGSTPGGHPAAGGDPHAEGVPAALEAALAQLSLPMLLGHLLAAAALGWLLSRGDAALWRLVRLSAATARAAEELLPVRALRTALRLLRALRHGLTTGDGTVVTTTGAASRRTAPRCAEPLAGAVTRRGPPALTDAYDLAA